MAEIKYSSEHEWVSIEGDIATIGITDYVQSVIGDVIFIGLPTLGQEIKRGDCVAVIESVKTAVDVFCPVSGLVQDVNEAITEDPDLLNRDPGNGGWLFKLALTHPEEKDDLLSCEDYKKVCDDAQRNE